MHGCSHHLLGASSAWLCVHEDLSPGPATSQTLHVAARISGPRGVQRAEQQAAVRVQGPRRGGRHYPRVGRHRLGKARVTAEQPAHRAWGHGGAPRGAAGRASRKKGRVLSTAKGKRRATETGGGGGQRHGQSMLPAGWMGQSQGPGVGGGKDISSRRLRASRSVALAPEHVRRLRNQNIRDQARLRAPSRAGGGQGSAG